MAAPPNLPSSTSAAASRPLSAATTATAKSPPRPQAPHPSSSLPLYHFYASQNPPIRPQTQTRPQSLNSVPSSQQGILYPLASSGRGFISRPVRPPDHSLTVANLTNLAPGVYNPSSVGVHRPVIAPVSGAVSASPSSHPHMDSGFSHRSRASYVHHHHPAHLIRKHPAPLQHQQQSNPAVEQYMPGSLPPIRGIPFAGQLKVSSSPLPVADSNGHRSSRSRDDVVTIRDRKVRIVEDSSLYALCRSWLRNGFPEETQPHYREVVQVLPEPLPLSDDDIHSKKKEGEEGTNEDEESVDDLSPQDLLKRHIKHAKKVRARLREGRLKRIARFKTRLAMLLPPQVEQLRNDTLTGS